MVGRGTLTLLVWLIATARTGSGSAYGTIVVSLPVDVASEQQKYVVDRIQDLLTKASQVLYKAIGWYFGDIVCVVPLSWQTSSLDVQYEETGSIPSKADVVVTSTSDSVFGKSPHALQFGPCEQKGLRVNVPLKFLLRDVSAQSIDKGKLFAREWIKMRYGVFDENGYENDARFPSFYKIFGTEDIKITSCTNAPISYVFRDRTGSDCSLEVDKMTNFPKGDSDCRVEIDESKSNENLTSSLLDLNALNNVDSLCDDASHPHRDNVPNKQNVLCRERSIWSVLKSHADFKDKEIDHPSSEPAPSPNFRYVKESINRIVVAIDAHISLAKYKGHIKNAVAHMVYLAPPNTEFGVTTGKEEPLQILPEVENYDFGQLNNYILSTTIMFRKTEACPECVVKTAIQMLSTTSMKYGTIILISSMSPRDLDPELINSLKKSFMQLIVIYFSNFQESLEFVGLRNVYRIPDEDSLETLKRLYEAVETAIRPLSQTKKIKLLTTEISSSTSQILTIDQTVDMLEFWFSNRSALDLEMDHDDFVVESAQSNYPQVLSVPVQKNFFLLRAKNIGENSQWKCTLRNVSPVLMNVVAVLKAGDHFEISAWINDDAQKASIDQLPIVLYVRVSFGGHPIIHGRVKADAIRPDDSKSESFYLLDNGFGDPDITKNDGIYSRYFTQLTTSGQYEVIFSIDDNDGQAKIARPSQNAPEYCCGSETVIGDLQDIKPFQRDIKLIFKAKNDRPDDGYGPSTITDLRILRRNGSYWLIFTAPGAEKDYGKVIKYKLQQCHKTNETSNCNDDQRQDVPQFTWKSNFSKPRSYGETEEFQLQIAENMLFNTFYFLSIVSTNDRYIESASSNRVEVFLLKNHPDPTDESPKPDSTGNSAMEPATIGYITGAVLAVICVIVAYLIFCSINRRKKRLTAEETVESSKDNPSKDDGSVTAKEWTVDRNPISPVNSVPAAVLLYHHEQVKDAKRRHQEPPLFTLEDIDGKKLPSTCEGSTKTLDDYGSSTYVNRAMEDSSESISCCLEQPPPKPLRRITKV